jgi:acyl-CoA thioesterase-1
MESAKPSRQSQSLGRAWTFVAALTAGLLMSAPATAQTIRLVALGDSLTAGYRLDKSQAFPAVLERALKAKGWDVAIANAGVSGDTAAAGADRVDWSVPDGTQGVILEFGGNDALRGLPPEQTRKSLVRILDRLKARNIPVLIAGMYAPRSLGAQYYEKFDAIFPELAKEYGHDLYPFFLDGVVGDMNFNLEDGMHPNDKGVARIVQRMLPAVETFLRRIQGG